jgi:CubicO group peptidase (beta-lactamase class C family)
LLVGIALADGVIDSLDQPIADLLPAYAGVLDDPAKRAITVRDLLTMQSGLESTSSRNYGGWVASSDWVRDALRRPVECEPGSCWGYSTGTTHILGVIVARRTGRSLRDYASERLFGPLGIPVRAWDRDPQGNYLGGNNMSFRPVEFLRLGRLLLDEGVVDGRRLIPAEWLDLSWRRYARSPYNGNGYGFHWWNRRMGDEHVVFAWGYGGQFLYVVPRLDLAVVVTSTLASGAPTCCECPRLCDAARRLPWRVGRHLSRFSNPPKLPCSLLSRPTLKKLSHQSFDLIRMTREHPVMATRNRLGATGRNQHREPLEHQPGEFAVEALELPLGGPPGGVGADPRFFL